MMICSNAGPSDQWSILALAKDPEMPEREQNNRVGMWVYTRTGLGAHTQRGRMVGTDYGSSMDGYNVQRQTDAHPM